MSIEGLWNLSVQTPDGEFKGTLELAGERAVTGRMANTLGGVDFCGSLDGDQFEFGYVYPEEMGRLVGMTGRFIGTVAGDEMSGQMFLDAQPFAPWTASRA